MKKLTRPWVVFGVVAFAVVLGGTSDATDPDLLFNVSVPTGVNTTIHDETDYGDERMNVANGGWDLTHYNFPQTSVVSVRTKFGVFDPAIQVCTGEGVTKAVQFYDCDNSSDNVEVTLESEECAEGGDYDCVTVCSSATTCPL